jgi:Right handed beta helix region
LAAIGNNWENRMSNINGTAAIRGCIALFAGFCSFAFGQTTDIVVNIPASIASDCSRDVTSDLNAWLFGLKNKPELNRLVLVFKKNACYRVDGTFGTPIYSNYSQAQFAAGYKRDNLVLDGNGARIDGSKAPLKSNIENRAGIAFISSSNITIKNFTIIGNHPSPCNRGLATESPICAPPAVGGVGFNSNYEFLHGIVFFGGKNLEATDNKIINAYGDGIALGANPEMKTDGVRIIRNLIEGTGRMGVGLTGATNVFIRDNTFDLISYHVLDVEPESKNSMTNIVFDGNRIKRHYLSVLAAVGAECVARDVRISNNVMELTGGTTAPAIWVDPTSPCAAPVDIVLAGNTIIHANTGGGQSNGTTPYHNSAVKIVGVRNACVVRNNISQGSKDIGGVWLANVSGRSMVVFNAMPDLQHVYSYGGNFEGTVPFAYDGPPVIACRNTKVGGLDFASTPAACRAQWAECGEQ